MDSFEIYYYVKEKVLFNYISVKVINFNSLDGYKSKYEGYIESRSPDGPMSISKTSAASPPRNDPAEAANMILATFEGALKTAQA